MKLFEQPEVNVIKFAVEDVITVSSTEETAPSIGGMIVQPCIS